MVAPLTIAASPGLDIGGDDDEGPEDDAPPVVIAQPAEKPTPAPQPKAPKAADKAPAEVAPPVAPAATCRRYLPPLPGAVAPHPPSAAARFRDPRRS
jgi:hypothetical protein